MVHAAQHRSRSCHPNQLKQSHPRLCPSTFHYYLQRKEVVISNLLLLKYASNKTSWIKSSFQGEQLASLCYSTADEVLECKDLLLQPICSTPKYCKSEKHSQRNVLCRECNMEVVAMHWPFKAERNNGKHP